MPSLVVDKQYQDGSILTEDQLDAAFASITTLLNVTGLGADNIQDNSIGVNELQTSAVSNTKLATNSVSTAKIQDNCISKAKLDTALQLFLVPTGAVMMWMQPTAPSGWLVCDGVSTYSQATYPDLYNAIKDHTDQDGVAPGLFRVPDMRGAVPRMPGGARTYYDQESNTDKVADPDSARYSPYGTVGSHPVSSKYGSIQGSLNRSHNHPPSNSGGYFLTSSTPGGPANSFQPGGAGLLWSRSTDGDSGGNESRPVNVYMNFIIKT